MSHAKPKRKKKEKKEKKKEKKNRGGYRLVSTGCRAGSDFLATPLLR
jgi:hypothetical protein